MLIKNLFKREGEKLSILLTRIDDRLIHGQVMTAWVKTKSANRIIIVDDEVAKDSFMQEVLKMSAPSGIEVDIFSTKNAVEALKDTSNIEERIIILAKVPQTIYTLIESGVEIKELNVGGMGAKPGRKTLYKNISASKEEKDCFKKIIDKDVKVFIQIIPDNKSININSSLNK